MEILHEFLLENFSYRGAVLIEDSILALAVLIVGMTAAFIYSSYVMSMVKFDTEHNIQDDGISMIILKKKNRTRIIFPPQLSMPQVFMNLFIFSLYQMRIVRNSQVTIADVKKAKRIFFFVVLFSVIIVIVAVVLTTGIITHPEWWLEKKAHYR